MDQQNHLLSLIAVFIALGLGILVGVSMGDSTLVFNQIAVIEELEEKIHTIRQKNEEAALLLTARENELARWDYVKEKYLQPLFQNTLNNCSLILISGDLYPKELLEFLEHSGCTYRAFLLDRVELWHAEPPPELLFCRGGFEGNPGKASTYGQLFWQALQDPEQEAQVQLIGNLQDNGLLQEKKSSTDCSLQNAQNLYLLTGDLSFVTGVLKQGISPANKDYIWITLEQEANEAIKKWELPGSWFTIKNTNTFFGHVELWELLQQFNQQAEQTTVSAPRC